MGHKVLVVEDDTAIRETLIELLEDEGYEPVGAVNGSDALARLQSLDEPPCVILLDLMMPVMDGRAFRQAQLSLPPVAGIPVVVLTAHRDATPLADELRAEQILPKPLRRAELLAVVEQLCPGA